MFVCVGVCMCACACMYMYICTHVCVCMCVDTHQSSGWCWESFSITLLPYSLRKGFSIKPRAVCLGTPPRLHLHTGCCAMQHLDGFLKQPWFSLLPSKYFISPAWNPSFQRAKPQWPLDALIGWWGWLRILLLGNLHTGDGLLRESGILWVLSMSGMT